jgi:hypothetical protein
MTLLVQPMTPPWLDPLKAASVVIWPVGPGRNRNLRGSVALAREWWISALREIHT